MGNCLRHESSMKCAHKGSSVLVREGGLPADKKVEGKKGSDGKLGGELVTCGFQANDVDSSTTTRTTEVKIKITKKQLEELLGKVDLNEISVQQVLSHLINVSERFETHQRPWRPVLQSIPEGN